jgi:hypothetical protein
VLHIVQHQQEVLVLQVVTQRVAEWFAPGFAYSERIRDSGWNVVWVRDWRQVDEHRAMREVPRHGDSYGNC